MQKISEILRQAKSLIEDRQNWCQNALARDAFGDYRYPSDPCAIQFCASGALCKIDILQWQHAFTCLEQGATILYNMSVIAVNNGLGHDAVMDCYNYAIKLAEIEEL